ncbi:MAG: hypothetical protein Q9214_004671 [Letrouitia sp. 1 TL-2023]
MGYTKHYIPLESNPALFTELIHQLGVSPDVEFQDVFSIDDPTLLSFTPRPVLALVLVFPTSDVYEKQKAAEEAAAGEYSGYGDGEDVMWYKQTINNACGLYGILHAVSNGEAKAAVKPGSTLADLLDASVPLSPSERANLLENSETLESAYRKVALQGDSAVPENAEDEVDYHYVSFVKSSTNGHIYELDGDRKGPIDHGHTAGDLLDEDGLKIVRRFIHREQGANLNFSLLALPLLRRGRLQPRQAPSLQHIMAELVGAIIGLVATGVRVGGGLNELIANIKEAPKEFRALWTDEAEFREILSEVLEAQQLADLPVLKEGSSNYAGLVVQRSFEKLQEVRDLVQSVVKDRDDQTASPRVNRVKWLLKVKSLHKIQQDLQVQKSAVYAIKSDTHVRTILDELRMQTQSNSETRNMILEKQDSQLALLEKMTQMMSPVLTKPDEENDRIQSSFKGGKLTSPSFERISKEEKGFRNMQRNTEGESVKDPFARRSTKQQPLKCFDDCQCRCHRRSVARMPRQLSLFMGDIFLGFSNSSWTSQSLAQCSVQSCRRSRDLRAEMKYFLPPWLTINSIRFSLAFSVQEPSFSFSLETRNTIPYDSPIHLAVQKGHIGEVQQLLCTRTTSLNDVDPFGLGLLYYASHYCERSSGHDIAMKTTQKLLSMGAHADWEDEIGNTPSETMTDDVLAARMINSSIASTAADERLVDIARIFGKCSNDLLEDYIDELEFSPVHKALLGLEPTLTDRSLKDVLADFDKEPLMAIIDKTDARGRTPLAWAVEFGCPEAVSTLIQYGANPHQLRKCTSTKSPLLHLVIAAPSSQEEEEEEEEEKKEGKEAVEEKGCEPASRFLDVVRILLESGVDINAVDHEGWTALHVAASWNLLDMVTELARMGRPQLNWDAVTMDGQTALDLCRGDEFDERVEAILISHGKSLHELVTSATDRAGITGVQECAREKGKEKEQENKTNKYDDDDDDDDNKGDSSDEDLYWDALEGTGRAKHEKAPF